jgi:hypothetical protein
MATECWFGATVPSFASTAEMPSTGPSAPIAAACAPLGHVRWSFPNFPTIPPSEYQVNTSGIDFVNFTG